MMPIVSFDSFNRASRANIHFFQMSNSLQDLRPLRHPMPPAMKGFEFRQRRDAIHWRLLASMDVDKIVKNVIILRLVHGTGGHWILAKYCRKSGFL